MALQRIYQESTSMNRHQIKPNAFFQMQDIALSRAQAVARDFSTSVEHLEALDGAGAPPVNDRQVLHLWWNTFAEALATAWAAARARRGALKQLKRVDRKLLMDLGIPRGQLRDVVDAMNAVRARDEARQRVQPQAPAWMARDLAT